MIKWAKSVLDIHIAPDVSKFHSAYIPDMSSKKQSWLDKFFLNSVLRNSFKEEVRPFVFNYLRRTEEAFTEHGLARDLTLSFLDGRRDSVSLYMKALYHWEAFLSQSWLAYELLVKVTGNDVFKKDDNSIEEKLNYLYNISKHTASAIKSGQLSFKGTVSVWMVNKGLKSTEHLLTWEDTEYVLDELSTIAHILEDSLSARNRLNKINNP